jgi:hypothetical protein
MVFCPVSFLVFLLSGSSSSPLFAVFISFSGFSSLSFSFFWPSLLSLLSSSSFPEETLLSEPLSDSALSLGLGVGVVVVCVLVSLH